MPGERWVVVGPNGAGKTTLHAIAGTDLWPSTGSVEVLGERIGRVDARDLRRRMASRSTSGTAPAGSPRSLLPGVGAGRPLDQP